MKPNLLVAVIVFLFLQMSVYGQRNCGIEKLKNSIIDTHPGMVQHFEKIRHSLQSVADVYIKSKSTNALEKTTSDAPVPVIFHFILDSAQFNELGGTAGIKTRCDSQLIVLNRDYNRQNPDSTLIPSGWMPLYASVGIHFGLAHRDPSNNYVPGYEIKIISNSGFTGSTNAYSNAKHTSTGGLDAWDYTSYMNVWCVSFSDNPGLLGTTVPKSFTIDSFGTMPNNEEGIVVRYNSVGKRTAPGDSYPAGGVFDEGRTLTHEIGHFFEIWHVWGDDGGLCPWATGAADDGLSDTPPQGNHSSGNPTYTVTGGTIHDGCEFHASVDTQVYGIACLSYLDYTDDNGMHMFTTQQAAVMASCVSSTYASPCSGESHSLVTNPYLTAAVENVELNYSDLYLFPNPTNGIVTVNYDPQSNDLQEISVLNIVGQETLSLNVSNNKSGNLSIDLHGLDKGFYFVKCIFAHGTTTRKILLQ